MRDLPIILAGLAAFLGVATLPFWYNALTATPGRLQLQRPVAAKQCVLPVETMRRSHMDMLNAWRDRKVRDGILTQAGYEISLTHTCLEQCHRNKAEFCDRCHAYVGAKNPPCFDCHTSSHLVAERSLAK